MRIGSVLRELVNYVEKSASQCTWYLFTVHRERTSQPFFTKVKPTGDLLEKKKYFIDRIEDMLI